MAYGSVADIVFAMKITIDRLAPPSIETMEQIAQSQLKSLPDEFSRFVQDLIVRVDDFPDDETMEELDLENEFELLGLYRGVALNDKSLNNTATDVDMVFLYRRPILDYWCETEEDLGHLVRHVLIHEIGHHFGLSDDDMEKIENAPERSIN